MLTKIVSVGLLCVLLFSKTNSRSVSQLGDVRIDLSNDKWQCDRIECPLDVTERCFVSKISDPNNPSILTRTNICYSKDNQVLTNQTTTEATDPNQKIRMQVNSYRNGNIMTSANNFKDAGIDEEQFHKDLNADLKKMREEQEREMAEARREMDKEMANLKHELEQMNQEMSQNFGSYY